MHIYVCLCVCVYKYIFIYFLIHLTPYLWGTEEHVDSSGIVPLRSKLNGSTPHLQSLQLCVYIYVYCCTCAYRYTHYCEGTVLLERT